MRAQGRAALERVQAAHLAAKPLTEMSTGERRRVLIARALVTRPEVLVLDEPTTGLDFVARHQFLESVRRLAREGTTILIVTHHVEEVIPEIRRVVLLARGRAAFDGTPAEALTSDRLAAVYGAPLAVERQGDYYAVRVGGARAYFDGTAYQSGSRTSTPEPASAFLNACRLSATVGVVSQLGRAPCAPVIAATAPLS